MQVGLFFGSFNPIHIGHLAIANYMVEFTEIEQLWFVISPHNPLKEKKSLLDNYQRYEMVCRAIEHFPNMQASTIEFSLPQPSYTIHALAHLEEKYPQHTFSLIMGADNVVHLHAWKHSEHILENYHIYVYNRPEISQTHIPETYKNHTHIHFVDAPLMEISSSFIRRGIAEKKNIRAFMPDAAWQYLDEMNFYKNLQ
ncbi:MAG: nicotinate-nucleotide adenylyltransferase [Bacteroidales bacterium]|jgi:nicotinate-nucleotide adenylyltransferase|nr:nicotinate-nucleotide adenylyltransferase [Bacteroidales bacterium]